MSAQPEALWLVEVMPYLEGGERGQWIIDAAAELRRLHAIVAAREDDIETHSAAVYEATRLLAQAREQRDALLEALKMIAGTAPCIDNLMSDKDIARAAIKAVKENT